MKPFYASKKFWAAVVTSIAAVVSYFYDPKLAALIAFVGSTLIVGFGLADRGKEAAAIDRESWRNFPPPDGGSN